MVVGGAVLVTAPDACTGHVGSPGDTFMEVPVYVGVLRSTVQLLDLLRINAAAFSEQTQVRGFAAIGAADHSSRMSAHADERAVGR
jgi:hypothetical protein